MGAEHIHGTGYHRSSLAEEVVLVEMGASTQHLETDVLPSYFRPAEPLFAELLEGGGSSLAGDIK